MRVWIGLAALGAGIVHLGVAATTVPPLLVTLTLLGAGEVLAGVALLAGRAERLQRLVLPGLAAPILLWLVSLLLPAAAHGAGGAMGEPVLPFGAMAGASALDLLAATLLAVRLRGRGTAGEQRPIAFVASAAASATVVAVVVANSLSATALGAGMVMH